MLSIRCKECGREVSGHPTQARSCGCPNMATVKGDSISAVDLDKVVMLNSYEKDKDNSLSPSDLQWQEERRKRKVRKLDFEVR